MSWSTHRSIPAVFFSFFFFICGIFSFSLHADDKDFHNAPDSAKAMKNPYQGQASAVDAGKTLYARNCLSCHGKAGKGTGNIPSLVEGKLNGVPQGEVFWFVTQGDKDNGMPSWAFLPEQSRWQIISYVEALAAGKVSAATASVPAAAAVKNVDESKDASPHAPFTDYRYEKPGVSRKITVNDLPQPYETQSANKSPDVVDRPANAWPIAPAGFKVEMYANGLDNPRWMRTAPNGDIFLAESEPGKILVFRGMSADGKAQTMETFASGLKRPYGIAFYPPGPNPEWVYIGSEGEIARFPYHNGDLKASGASQHIADLPTGGGHWTRAVEFTPDGKKMFVGVGWPRTSTIPTRIREKRTAPIFWFAIRRTAS